MAGRSRKKYFMEQEAITLYNVFSGEVRKKYKIVPQSLFVLLSSFKILPLLIVLNILFSQLSI